MLDNGDGPRHMGHMDWQKPINKVIEDLGADIAAFRLSRNLSQDDVADQAGIGRRTLVRLEAGKNPTLDSLIRVLRVLGLDGRVGTLVPAAEPSPLDARTDPMPRLRARKAQGDDGDSGRRSRGG